MVRYIASVIARRAPLSCRETVHKLLQHNYVLWGYHLTTKNPLVSPNVLVGMYDGSSRFCLDYRKINKGTCKDAYRLLRVDDSLDTLAGYRWFSTLDLKSGYRQVEVAQNIDRRLLFVYTQEGLFEFKVMIFLLCNVPASPFSAFNGFDVSRASVISLSSVLL